MRITAKLLLDHGACEDQCDIVAELWPDGAEPTVEVLKKAQAAGLDALWAVRLLPLEGPGSQRAFALRCVEPIIPLMDDKRSTDCVAVVRRRVDDPASVTDAAWAAAWPAARDAARAAAWPAAWPAAWDAARAAQLACLSEMLLNCEQPKGTSR